MQINRSSPATRTATLTAAADITPVAIQWLFQGVLARGKIHILAGHPGTGKTQIASSIASIISTGGELPDGSTAEIGETIIWSGEDSPEDTLVPRIIAMGGNLEKIHFLTGVKNSTDDSHNSFDPASDLPLLRATLDTHPNIRLIIIDPFVAIISGDSHKNTEVRNSMSGIEAIAHDYQVAVFGITHLTKGTSGLNPVETVTGSIAFAAAPRIVMSAFEKEGQKYFALIKSNIGSDRLAFSYKTEPFTLEEDSSITTSRIVWGELFYASARDIMHSDKKPKPAGKLADAIFWLEKNLQNGPARATEIQDEAKKIGISESTLRRARTEMGLVIKRKGKSHSHSSYSEWSLSADVARAEPKNLAKDKVVVQM